MDIEQINTAATEVISDIYMGEDFEGEAIAPTFKGLVEGFQSGWLDEGDLEALIKNAVQAGIELGKQA